ncbi:MAG TPA: hypothetical protein VK148_08630 [Xanthobacteraceae bacterium]|jgi:hypothetical protein|nr:hypothetical protein [Xanthobacteraceae bacterium]
MMKTLAAAALVVTTMGFAAPVTANPIAVTGNFNINGLDFGGPVLSMCQLYPQTKACAAHPQSQAHPTTRPQTQNQGAPHSASQHRRVWH